MHVDVALEVEWDDPKILVDFLLSNINLSKTRLKKCMLMGSVWLEDEQGKRRVRRATTKIAEGDIISVFYDEARLNSNIVSLQLLAQFDGYSVWYKPQGVPFEGDDFGDEHAVVRQIELHCHGQPFWFVCLPSDAAGGLMLLAQSRRAAAGFEQLQEQSAVESQLRFSIEQSPSEYDSLPEISLVKATQQHSKLLLTTYCNPFSQLDQLLKQQSWSLVEYKDEAGHTLTQEASLSGLSFQCPIDKQTRHFDLQRLLHEKSN